MTDKRDSHGSKCGTLTDAERSCIISAVGTRPKGRLTYCGQHLWDSDDYLAHSVGTLHKRVHNLPSGTVEADVRLDWCDHGDRTHYFINGYHIASSPSFPTAKVSATSRMESLWSAGKVIAYHLISERRRQEQDDE